MVFYSLIFLFATHFSYVQSFNGLPKTRLSRSTSIKMMATASTPKKVLILGGDGFCGWPTSLYLSEQGKFLTQHFHLTIRYYF
jgi:hypothetical protein